MSKILLDKIQGCLLGVLLGDALGMPWEAMTRQEILQRTNNQGVTGFQEGARKITDNHKLKLGGTTDDWQLTKIVAESIIDFGAFHREHMAYFHVEALNSGNTAWGKTTKNAIEGLAKRVIWLKDQKMTRRPSECSNGVMMKIAPLAIYFYLAHGQNSSKLFLRKVIELGSITHSDARAIASAYVLGATIIELLQSPDKITKGAHMFANKEHFISNFVKLVGFTMDFCPCDCEYEDSLWHTVSVCLQHASNVNFLAGKPNTFFAPRALGVVMVEFLKEPENFQKSGPNIINIGGDTDTTASMLGALVGVNVGIKAFPQDWIHFCPQAQEAIDLGEKLYNQFKS